MGEIKGHVTVISHYFRSWPKLIELKNYKDPDVGSLKRDLEQAPWDICKPLDDINDSTWCWEQLYENILKKLQVISLRK